jgi:hypothetical protein
MNGMPIWMCAVGDQRHCTLKKADDLSHGDLLLFSLGDDLNLVSGFNVQKQKIDDGRCISIASSAGDRDFAVGTPACLNDSCGRTCMNSMNIADNDFSAKHYFPPVAVLKIEKIENPSKFRFLDPTGYRRLP